MSIKCHHYIINIGRKLVSKELRLRFSGIFTGGLPPVEGSARVSPRARLTLGNFEVRGRLEGAFTNTTPTPIGAKPSDGMPSSSLNEDSFLSFWQYQPKNKEDNFRGNFGLRRLTIGGKDISLYGNSFIEGQIGIHRWDRPDLEDVCMKGVFNGACKFAFASFPIGLLGGEFKYKFEKTKVVKSSSEESKKDQVNEEEVIDKSKETQAYTSIRFSHVGKKGQWFLMPQIGVLSSYSSGFAAGMNVYFGLYSHLEEDPHYVDSGLTKVMGGGAWLEYEKKQGEFRLLVAASGRKYKYRDEFAIPGDEQRRTVALSPSYERDIGKIRLLTQGNITYLSRCDWKENKTNEENQKNQEWNLEVTVGIKLPPFHHDSSTIINCGYYGVLPQHRTAIQRHMGFCGLRIDFRHKIPIQKEK